MNEITQKPHINSYPNGYVLKGKKGLKSKKALLIGVGIIGVGAAGYLAYSHFSQPTQVPIDPSLLLIPTNVAGQSTTTWPEGSFPIKKGDKTKKVYRLQNALVKKAGTGAAIIQAAGGADGIYGNGTEKALIAEGYVTVIDEPTYNKILTDASASTLPATNVTISPQALASEIFNAASQLNLSGVLAGLKKMKSVADYSAVNVHYKLVTNQSTFVSMTLVTHLLDKSFTNETDKQAIRSEFLRMGLKYNNNVWSLSGLGSTYPAVTTKITGVAVRDHDGKIHTVQKNTILGLEFARKEGLSFILTANNAIVSAPSKLLNYQK